MLRSGILSRGWVPTILTLVLGVTAAASDQTKGDARCANSTSGKYWVATSYGGYCASSPATPSASAQPQVQPICPTGQTWVKTTYGGACFSNETAPFVRAEQQRKSAEIQDKNKHLAEIQAQQDALYEAEAKKLHKHPTVSIQVVDTEASARQYNYYIPGTSGHSTTNCNGSATATTYGTITTANGTETCDTTSTPGRPATIGTGSIAQSNVHAIMADGTHVTLWCQAGFRRCANLSPGTYQAEIDGNSVWMFTSDLGGKGKHKIKYHWIGGW